MITVTYEAQLIPLSSTVKKEYDKLLLKNDIECMKVKQNVTIIIFYRIMYTNNCDLVKKHIYIFFNLNSLQGMSFCDHSLPLAGRS